MPGAYDRILEAARECDANKLHAILREEGVAIDVWKQGSYFFSAASQVAAEGNWEAVKFLMEHGANFIYVVRGAAFGGHRSYAEKLREQTGVDISFVAAAAAFGGHLEYAEELRQKGAWMNQFLYKDWYERFCDLSDILESFAIGGHWGYVEELMEHSANVDSIVKMADVSGYLKNKESISSFLLYFRNDAIRDKLADAIIRRSHESGCMPFKLNPYIPKDIQESMPRILQEIKQVCHSRNAATQEDNADTVAARLLKRTAFWARPAGSESGLPNKVQKIETDKDSGFCNYSF